MQFYRIFMAYLASVLVCSAAALAGDKVPALIEDLSSARGKAERIAAAKALGESHDRRALQAVEALSDGCRDSDVEIRNACVVALGTLAQRYQQNCPVVIVEAMLDQDETIRTNAAALVSLIKNLTPEGIQILYQNVNHDDPVIRANMMMPLAIADGESPKAIGILEQAAHDADVGVRINAAAGLWRATEDLSRLVPLWLAMLEAAPEGNATDRQAPLTQLGAIVATSKLREQGRSHPREVAAELVKALADKAPEIRLAAARALGAIAQESAAGKRALRKANVRSALLPLLEDSDLKVRAAAITSLESLKSP